MKEQALNVIRAVPNPGDKLNLLREYMQAFALRSLHESEAFNSLSFVGGTALRFVFNLPRFSEDLDFSLEADRGYQLEKWFEKLKRDMGFAGFQAVLTFNDRKPVHVVWIRVPNILREAGIAAIPNQKLSIKLEIDTHPPAGAVMENRVVNRHFLMAIRHHDISSLMAGKIHALCVRKYAKGRDWYDFLWYRARVPPIEPNLKLLQSALDQTEGERTWPAGEWQNRLLRRLEQLDEKQLRADVASFLERPADRELLTRERIAKTIRE